MKLIRSGDCILQCRLQDEAVNALESNKTVTRTRAIVWILSDKPGTKNPERANSPTVSLD